MISLSLPVTVLIGTVTTYSVALGGTYAGLAVAFEREGYSAFQIALNAAMSPLGLIIASLALARGSNLHLGRSLRWAVIAAAGLTAAITVFIHSFGIVMALRFMLGCATTVLFVIGESTLMDIIPKNERGRILSLYNAIVTLGYAIGPILLLTTGSPEIAMTICAVIIAINLVPLACIRPSIDRSLTQDAMPSGLRGVSLAVPALILLAGCVALFDNATLSLLPSAVSIAGASATKSVTLITVTLIGAVLLQAVVGAVSDHLDRRRLFKGLVTMSSALAAASFLVPVLSLAQFVIFFILGGTTFGSYSIALALIADTFKGSALVAANAALSLAWGIGSFIGVPAIGFALDHFGATAFGWSVALAFTSVIFIYNLVPMSRGSERTRHVDS